ncbi:MAG: hypothetical protein PHX44_03775 [Sulfurimonas sp.]|uniref:hypothetical protein n=1 Tax=Sulfurimonas sp. TaxID=2022749 RepID=UPI00261CA208|nr:hypothetical protein [Sulfurimonas sp.]MDD2652149.1 hypothetical protein [Sulfurimonas sp.]MDD3450568.1 hypothetical protein [Sulfurimonas sp.]
MRFFKFFFLFISLVFALGCSSSDAQTVQKRMCPKCNMPLPDSSIHTATLEANTKKLSFDDIGCLVLWAKEHDVALDSAKIEVFSNDTHKYIDAQKAFFTINEKTPMNYGFAAYEAQKTDTIPINEVTLKMLRGEHMANPKIRKQILGN